MYTIEKHLKQCAIDNPEFELLYSIWTLNKKTIPKAQDAISFNFPHYSLHEKSHSDTIIKNIESFLGSDRIKNLSPTDSWLILMSSYTHDLGMVIFQNTLEKNWTEEDFQEYLEKVKETSRDKDLRDAATLILKTQNLATEKENTGFSPLKIRTAVILLTADYYRKTHHNRSKEIISGNDTELHNLLNGFNLNGIPNRFSNIISEIAYAHGIDFYSIFERLEYIADGISNDKIHPRFIAYLLRLGDLLDVDDKRFNDFYQKAFSTKQPHTSELHKEKHASVKHLLISPYSIEITVDCKSDEVYRVARDWFDWLQTEVANQSREWSNIAPANLIGMPPTIAKGKIRILYRSTEPHEKLMNLRFSISNEKVFELFEGSAIYEKAEFVFLRELIQNAIDASKIQIWHFIKAGVYDFLFKKHLNLEKNLSTKDILSKINYPPDIPVEIFEMFQIDLEIKWSDDTQKKLKITVSDRGTGISESELIRMTQNVAESRANDTNYQKTKKTMPYWLRPTGAFGIGLQSLFLVANKFTVQTKTESSTPIEIEFYSSKNGDYSRITDFTPVMNRGTNVIVEIDSDNFDEIFDTTFPVQVIDRYDQFSDIYGNLYIHKIINYVLSELTDVELLNIKVEKESIKKSVFNSDVKFIDFQNSQRTTKSGIQVVLVKNNSSNATTLLPENEFHVYENNGIGSDMIFKFITEYNVPLDGNFSSLRKNIRNRCLVRDMPIANANIDYYKCQYCFFQWNLQSPESDKILNISRDKLVSKTKHKLQQVLLNNIFPIVLQNIITLFEKEYLNKTDEKIATEYFHIELTALMCKVPINSVAEIYSENTLPKYIGVNKDLSPIKYIDFFKAKKILICNKSFFSNRSKQRRLNELEIIEYTGEYDLVIWDEDYLSSYFLFSDYILTDYYVYTKEDGFIYLQLLQKDDTYNIVTNDLANQIILPQLISTDYRNKRRPLIMPLEKYADTLAVNRLVDGFADTSAYLNNYIISPLKNLTEYNNIKLDILQYIKEKDNQKIMDVISRSYINDLVPYKLTDFIIENSSNPQKEDLNRDKILHSYCELLTDLMLLEFHSKELEKYSMGNIHSRLSQLNERSDPE